ncbi:MAG: ATP-binding protein [Erysipelotrichaceae bacterium]|jgi:predicted AAA+ superfamily ATPase|nr:ATP-binding protein [Erysipelotrichaceae bacterium]
MFERKLVSQLVNRMQEPRKFIQIVEGPRQTGKTTAVLQALNKLDIPQHYVSADDPTLNSLEWIRNEWQRARLLSKDGDAILILDELQKIEKWSEMVKLLWDEDSRNHCPLKVIITGSSALLLKKGMKESLKGRFEVLYCTHWNYQECKDAFGYSLDDFLLFGGFPGSSSLIQDEERWVCYMREAIINPTLTQDVMLMDDIRKPALLDALFALGSIYSGQEVSYTKLLGQLQDVGNTVTLAHYLDLLSDAGVITGLQKYANSPISVRKSSPRLLVYDTSLMSYHYGTNRRSLLNHPAERGHLVESAIGAYLLARGKEEGFGVYWWRDRSEEVDFVIQKGSSLTALEVKSGRIKHTGGTLSFKSRYPHALSLIIGSSDVSVEDFLLGKQPLFLE